MSHNFYFTNIKTTKTQKSLFKAFQDIYFKFKAFHLRPLRTLCEPYHVWVFTFKKIEGGGGRPPSITVSLLVLGLQLQDTSFSLIKK